MKTNHFFTPTKTALMAFVFIISIICLLASCDKLFTCKQGYLKCDDKYCCPEDTPYSDSHGTCWGSLEACRETGYPCQKCW